MSNISNFINNRAYFNVGITYLHDKDIRTAYFRAKTVQEAINRYNEICTDPIIEVLLDNEIFDYWLIHGGWKILFERRSCFVSSDKEE